MAHNNQYGGCMAIDDKAIALRLLIRRGITPSDIGGRDDEILEHVLRRFARGNISIQKGAILTAEELETSRETLRQQLLHKKAP